jgi:DNA-binding beta-propeller fold protein YncE
MAAACTAGSGDPHALSGSRPHAAQLLMLRATWTAYQLPQPVSGQAAVAKSGQIVLAGGQSGGRLLRSVTLLTPRTGQLQLAGALPTPATDAAAALVHGRLTVFGGTNRRSITTVQTPGQRGQAPSLAGPARLPQARSGLAAVTDGGTTYLVGGGSPGRPAPAVLGTTDGTHFAVVASLPVPVAFAGAVASAGQLWVFGGMAAAGTTSVIQRVDPHSGRARIVGRLPHPLAAASAFVLGGRIFLAGGVTAAAGGPGRSARLATSNAVLAFDSRAGVVTAAGVLPMPVAHAASAVVNTTAYLLGGTDGSRAVPAVVALRLVPATGPDPAMPWLAPASGPGHLAPGSDPSALPADVLVADHLNNRLVIIDPQGRIRWVFPKPGDLAPGQTFRVPDDAFFSADGRYIVATQEDDQVVSVISVATSKIVYRYGKPGTPGMGPNRVDNPDDAMLLPGGDIIFTDIKNCRIIIVHPPEHRPARIIGQTTNACAHGPPQHFGSPNGAFPMTNGSYVVTEINGDWASGISLGGHVQWSTHPPGVLYPSDTNEVYPGRYLTTDYSNPGQVVEFTPAGQLLWRFGGLNQPSLAIPMANGNILVNDDFNHRIIVINPASNRIVWQYGHTGVAGRAPGYLNDPDGLDLVPPDSYLIRNAATTGQP